MHLLDDEGNLFGVVNVVDALVVLVVLAVVGAGGAILLQEPPEPTEPNTATTHATLDLGEQPTYIVAAINEGDAFRAGGNSHLTVTDVHLTPGSDGTRVIIRAELHGIASGDSISYAGAPPRLGRSLNIQTNRYEVSGQIRAVGDNASLRTESTTVVLRSTMATPDAREVAAGDEVRVAGRIVATVDEVMAYSTDEPSQRVVFATVSLRTHRQLGERRFGGSPVARGQDVRLSDGDYTLEGRIVRIGTGLQRDSADVLIEDVVDVETATRIAAGDVATVAGHETAEVANVVTYATGDPDRKRVFVGLSLETLVEGDRELFGSVPVQRGNTITFDTAEYELSGTIQRVGAVEPRGTVTTRTVTLRMSEVRADMADAIRAGMTERAGGNTVATVTDVSVEPTLMIVTGDDGSVNVVDHPLKREVTLTTELRVRESTTGVRFKGQTIQHGSTVTLDLGTITVEGTVVSIGG